ncbi:exopolysaccharide biosynthesis protein [Methanosphaera sp. ISO3-F5]|uniref:exopolysaccharide biosynthesis protein n=1 Tax=Methanosphaera sp. ISO3-F5 TaxID=1452353 RepID=UPI002B25F171|nr:exopolysaccharide biosynthesis protein [Methanosphaera sp. ISO3-F5]WQH64986.1 exopolysaccharide biosynthesis protein [Methanosphaera sp. ISO3-F5]
MTERLNENSLTTSKNLKEIQKKLPSGNLTLNELTKILSTEGVQFFIIILLAPFLIPVSIPGSSTPFGILIILLEISFLRNKPIYIPNFIGKYEISKTNVLKLFEVLEKVFGYLEKISKPRGSLYKKKYAVIANGLMTIILALLLFLPLPIPFTDFTPALSILMLSLSILEKDSYLMILGFIAGFLTMLYFISVGYIGIEIIKLTINYILSVI